MDFGSPKALCWSNTTTHVACAVSKHLEMRLLILSNANSVADKNLAGARLQALVSRHGVGQLRLGEVNDTINSEASIYISADIKFGTRLAVTLKFRLSRYSLLKINTEF